MFDVITTSALILCIAFVLPCQLLLCFRVKSVIIRLLPLIAFLILTVIFAVLMFKATGWDGLGYMLLALYSAILFGVCGICWGAFAIVKIVQKRRNKTNINE